VETVRVAVVEVPLVVAGLGENEHATPFGSVPQLSATGWENPPTGAIERAKVADIPAGTVADAGNAEIVKSVDCPTPVPVSRMLCGLPGAVSLIVTAPRLWPGADGL
jgi:hypothetical protein